MLKILRLGLLVLVGVNSWAGTITGTVQNAAQGPVTNATFSFTLTAPATLSGTATIVTSTVNCYTDQNGNVVGEPNPLVLPVVNTNIASGTLAGGTYYTRIAILDATGTSFAGPETVTNLASAGSLIVAAPLKQPLSATGYKVFIGTSSGSETLQGTVTGTPGTWANFTQSATLAAGAALPVSNTTVCTILFNDQLTPSFTCYDVGLTSSTGANIPGYPAYWYLNGGSAGTINVGSGTPQSNVCQGQGVVYPQAIVSLPPFNATQTVNGGLNITGNVSVGGTLTAERFWKTCDASFYFGADDGAKIVTALADSSCSIVNASNLVVLTGASVVSIPNNKHVILPCGLYVGATTAFSVGSLASLRGIAQNCTIVSTNSGTANIIDIPSGSQWWGVSDLSIRSEIARTAGAGLGIHGGNGVAQRVVIYPVFDGAWADTASTADNNVLRDVQFTNGTGSPTAGSGGTWHCGFRNGGIAVGTVSGNTLNHVTAAMNTAFTDAGFCIQDGSDTVIIDGNSQAAANIGGSDSVALHLETVNGGSAPTNTQISDSTFEGGLTKNTIVIDSGVNTKLSNVTSQSGLRGVLINSCNGCSFKGSTFHLNQQEGIRIVSATGTLIEGNQFSENSQQTTNTFDDIFVTANITQFQIRGNTHADFFSTGKVCKWGVEVAAGTSNNYVIDDMNPGSCTTGAVTDGGTGLAKHVCSPGTGGCNIGNSPFQQMGSSSGTVTVQPPAAAGTPTMTWSTVSGIIGSVGTGTVTTNGTLIAAGACQAQTGISITGAATTDGAIANINAAIPATWQTGIRWFAEVQSNGTCATILCNPTAAGITPAATSLRCTVIHTQ